jgi:hypothetical protein
VSDTTKSNIDDVLVGIINAIMAVQMAASILIFSKTMWAILKQKFGRKVIPFPAHFDKVNYLETNNEGKYPAEFSKSTLE